ncbi:MAG TPA: type II toxin-antitoxin system HicA family toxin [Alphaproteobacteria bacterium]|nr:type II toxin-antitoxin system HicA family toxin [Alphaproteobacteria bacterium]
MTRREKLIERFYQKPKDFTWDELITLLISFGYKQNNRGKTGGSRRRFTHPNGSMINLHQPQPKKVLKKYQMEFVYEILEKEGFL